jgi:hypothetical protein
MLPHVVQHLKECKSRAVLIYEDDAQLACFVTIQKHAKEVRQLAPKGDRDTLMAFTSAVTTKHIRLRNNLLMAYCDFTVLDTTAYRARAGNTSE